SAPAMRPNLASLRAAERGPERLLHAEMFYPGPVGYRRRADAGRHHAMPGRGGAEAADRSAARLRGRVAQGRSRRRPAPVTALRRALAAEMAALARLSALVGDLPHDPLLPLVRAAQILRPEAPRLLGRVRHDDARLELRDWRGAALWSMVEHRRRAVVRVHLQ